MLVAEGVRDGESASLQWPLMHGAHLLAGAGSRQYCLRNDSVHERLLWPSVTPFAHLGLQNLRADVGGDCHVSVDCCSDAYHDRLQSQVESFRLLLVVLLT